MLKSDVILITIIQGLIDTITCHLNMNICCFWPLAERNLLFLIVKVIPSVVYRPTWGRGVSSILGITLHMCRASGKMLFELINGNAEAL